MTVYEAKVQAARSTLELAKKSAEGDKERYDAIVWGMMAIFRAKEDEASVSIFGNMAEEIWREEGK